MKNKARLLSTILTLAMVVSLMPAVTLPANAAELTVVSKGIYTNGNPVIIAGGPIGTLIYDDADADGEIDVGETSMALSGPSGDSTSGYDLSTYDIYGTSASASVSSSKITMLGGQVSYIFGAGPSSGINVTGNTDIIFKGGTAALLYGGGNYGSVGGNANVTVTGGTVSDSIVGGCGAGTVSGSTNVTITGGTIGNKVFGGGWGGSVLGTATVTVGVDATITGTVTSACSVGGTVGPGSSVIYEVAFYDASGGSKYTTGDYTPQWLLSGTMASKPATDPTQTGKTFSGWEKVSCGSAYDFTAAVSAAVKLYPGWLSTDATLKAASTTVKGQTVTDLGTPNSTFGSETAGSVTITESQAANTSNAGSFISLFDKNDTNADVKAVKYAAGDSTANFAGDTAYEDEVITKGDFFIVKVTAQDSATMNYYRINVTITTAPTATATGGKFTLGALGSVDLFSSVTASTNDDGQTFSGASLSVTNVSSTTEYLTVAGSDIPLISGTSGTFSVGDYRINVTGTTTSVLLSGMALDDTAMEALIAGITYKNSAASVTAGNRVIKLSLVTDSGSSNYTSTVLSIKSTVIVGNILSPDVETMDISSCSGGDVILIGAGRSVTLNGKLAALTNIQIICETGVTLTLNNVIVANTTFGYSPVTFTGENNTLIVTGENSLSAGATAPGVDVSGAALRIRGTGSLTARGIATTVGYGGAGIGTTDGATYDINIESGNITAIGGATNTRGVKALYPSLGISAADISITDGTVTATGYYGGAGIGSDGSADGSSITISGGVVTATADKFSVGIGCTTSAGRSDDKIAISGGRVIASCLPYTTYNGISYALGTGIGNSFRSYDGTGGTIELTGGEIFSGFALPDGYTAGGYDIGDANVIQSNTNWTVSIGGSAKVFLLNNRVSDLTTSTHINSTYDTGTAEVYGVTIPEGWQSTGFGVYLRPCTLSYSVNNGSGTAPDSVTQLYDTKITPLSNGSDLSKTGYHFEGWNVSEDGTGTNYAVGGTYTIKANTTLYAKWVGNPYTVTYDANGGTVDPISQVKLYSSTYGKGSDGTTDAAMPTPTWSGHTFSGWYTAASGGTKVTDSDTVDITENTTLYAHWTVNQFTVTFSTGGGFSVSSVTQDYDTKIETSPSSTKAGYTFEGWYMEEALANKISFPYTITASVTLYAKWAGEDSVDSTPTRTLAVTETSSGLFSGSEGQIKAEANMNSAFSSSIEIKVTDTYEKTSAFGFGAGKEVYPFDISLYIKGTNTKTEPKSGYAVSISLPVPDKLLDMKEQLSIVHKSDDGSVITLKSQLKQISGAWYLVFEATEFSPYALVISNTGAYDETVGLPYYRDTNGKEMFIGFAINGKYIAPSGTTVLFKENPKSFTDIGSHWAKSYIGFVTERELFTGTGETKFEPDTGMTRAMFATVIGRLYEHSYGEIADAVSGSTFTDVDYDGWYGNYVDWAADNSLITGIGSGLFTPDREITRQEMAAILYRFAEFLKISESQGSTELTYLDSENIASWARDAALYCQVSGLITGRDGGRFAPIETATRAEVAAILKRFVEAVV